MLLCEMGAVGGRMIGFKNLVSKARHTGRKKKRINPYRMFSLNTFYRSFLIGANPKLPASPGRILQPHNINYFNNGVVGVYPYKSVAGGAEPGFCKKLK